MTSVSKLQEEELNALNNEGIVELEEEVNLEELLILGEDKKIPIIISYPREDGKRIKAKALVKQLTLKELDRIQINRNNATRSNVMILEKALFKQDGSTFTSEELLALPIGVVNAIGNKILELSGVDLPDNLDLKDF